MGWLFFLINKCLSHNEKWKPNTKVIADVCDKHLLPGLKNARDAATRLRVRRVKMEMCQYKYKLTPTA